MEELKSILKGIVERSDKPPGEIRVGNLPRIKGYKKAGDLIEEIDGIPFRYDPQVGKGEVLAFWGNVGMRMFI